MRKKSQFQNLALQQTLQEAQENSQQPTVIQPALTLPIRREAAEQAPPALPSFPQWTDGRQSSSFTNQKTGELVLSRTEMPEEIDTLHSTERETEEEVLSPPLMVSRKKKLLRGAAVLLSALLLLALYLTWHSATPTSASPTVTQQSSNSSLQPTTASSTPAIVGSSGMIQVYILGAVAHPGVYTLPADARVYQLVQAAGGTLPGADLVALNLAAKLTDGEEIYVLSVGEIPPNSISNPPGTGADSSTPTVAPGQLVNINTATETEMEQALHVSSTTAKKLSRTVRSTAPIPL